MAKWMLGMIAVVTTACVSLKQAEPEIPSVLKPQTSGGESTDYLIRINFVMFEDEINQYPKTAKAFNDAIIEWGKNLPIEYVVFVKSSLIFQFGPSLTAQESDIIQVKIADLQQPPISSPPNVIGFWAAKDNTIYLDGDSMEIDQNKARMVCMHEIGHLFGLTHIVNANNISALTGYLVLPDELDAELFIMYAQYTEKNQFAKLSDLEVAIAKKNILSGRELIRSNCLHLTER